MTLFGFVYFLFKELWILNIDLIVLIVEDYDARNEAFWFRGGIQPDKSMIKKREGTKKMLDKHR